MHGKKLRCLDAFRVSEVGSWDLADSVAADVVERDEAAHESRDSSSAHTNTGIGAVIESIRLDLAAEGVEKSASYLKSLYETSDSWPPDQRFPPEEATFSAHLKLRGVKWDKRVSIMSKLVGKNGHVDARHIQRWITDQQPPRPLKPWEERVPQRLQSWTNLVLGRNPSASSLRALAVILHQEADRLEAMARR
ncbi:MAG: hypothetical protein J2P57_19845 [Acidimicrobiaceae bacterium]|nr:hypothetical protein [Acidimicrobiaceae bacterium]